MDGAGRVKKPNRIYHFDFVWLVSLVWNQLNTPLFAPIMQGYVKLWLLELTGNSVYYKKFLIIYLNMHKTALNATLHLLKKCFACL